MFCPVSYTHLDVYKRQPAPFLWKSRECKRYQKGRSPCGRRNKRIYDGTVDGHPQYCGSLHSVSYTHLDVYKRQELELGIGDTIAVYKANMIIPQIAENLTRSGVKDIPCLLYTSGTEQMINAVLSPSFFTVSIRSISPAP